jgi:hypothetical protein
MTLFLCGEPSQTSNGERAVGRGTNTPDYHRQTRDHRRGYGTVLLEGGYAIATGFQAASGKVDPVGEFLGRGVRSN